MGERAGCFAYIVFQVPRNCWLFYAVLWVCLQFVIVELWIAEFPDQTHYFVAPEA